MRSTGARLILVPGLCAAMLFAANVAAAGPPLPRDEAATALSQPRSVLDFMEGEDGAFVGLFLPFGSPLPRSEIELWMSIINASEAQRHFMETEYARFVELVNDVMEKTIPDYLRSSIQLGVIRDQSGLNSGEVLDALQSHLRHRNRVVQAIREVERNFIDVLQTSLGEEQEDLIHAVRARAARHWKGTDPLPAPGATVDLMRLWFASDRTSIDLDTQRQVVNELASSEVAIAALYRELETQRQERAIRSRRDTIRAYANQISAESYHRNFERRFERRARIARQLWQANATTAEEISLILSAPAQANWNSQVRQAFYPQLYPDRTALDRLFIALEADQLLDEAQRAAVSAFYVDYEFQIRRMNEELEHFVDHWHSMSTRGTDGYQRQFLPGELKPMLAERTELSDQWIARLEAVVGEAALLHHALVIPRGLPSAPKVVEPEHSHSANW